MGNIMFVYRPNATVFALVRLSVSQLFISDRKLYNCYGL